jgi:7-cyano-7-deazaguanine synthase in queuosine biosynthesis
MLVQTLSGATGELPQPLPVHLLLKGFASDLVWSELGRDLIEVACTIFLADRMYSRPRNTLGSRQIALRLPVRRPAAWKRVARDLEHALAILSDDVFSFDFYYSPQGAGCFPAQDKQKLPADRLVEHESKYLRHKKGARAVVPTVERVVLFSGGLDSSVAAAYFAARKNPTVYVTYYVRDIHRIEGLLKKIYSIYGTEKQPLHAQFYIKPERTFAPRLREHSRRSRSFLFVSLALATAHALNAREVCVCENGVIALNLPFIPAMIPTRHAHSSFLQTMERLAKDLFDAHVRVVNPFELQTKGEMSRIFHAQPQVALESVSCWNQQWAGRGANYGKGHCGYCVPCLVRRASLEAAGITIPKGHFDLDVRRLARHQRLTKVESERLGAYRALMSFTVQVQSCRSSRSFLRNFPDIINSEPTTKSQPPDEWFRNLFTMMKRFACEVEHTFSGV